MSAPLGPDFFNNAAAVLPILLLTKVADRARKEARSGKGPQGQPPGWSMTRHRVFVAVAGIGEALAFLGSALESSRCALLASLVAAALLVCGLTFGYELWVADKEATLVDGPAS